MTFQRYVRLTDINWNTSDRVEIDLCLTSVTEFMLHCVGVYMYLTVLFGNSLNTVQYY